MTAQFDSPIQDIYNSIKRYFNSFKFRLNQDQFNYLKQLLFIIYQVRSFSIPSRNHIIRNSKDYSDEKYDDDDYDSNDRDGDSDNDGMSSD
jgi:hypothetical protein